MEPIYVVGHRNPDTDSIVSAMAYAALRNALGDREFVPARLGQLTDETQMVLEKFGAEPPMLLHNVRTQVRDLAYDTPPALNAGVTVNLAWSQLHGDSKILALPIIREDGTLFGMLTRGDIATFDMYSIDHPVADHIPVFNLLSALEGRILNDSSNVFDTITGEVMIALPSGDVEQKLHRDSIVICGCQQQLVDRALAAGVSCVILCQSALTDQYRGLDSDTCVISTPWDAYRAARMIYQSIPIKRVCQTTDLVHFHLDDYLDDVREHMLQSRYRCYPILDEQDRVVGTLSRYHLIRPKRKRVVLVDHNEKGQSVPGIEQAEIVEIIDHHRLGDIVTTGAPVYFRNEPVGSTATIIATMYQEKGLMPPTRLAGLMCAAIVSDTVMFKSPTCTERDQRMAERMARIANVSLEELGYSIFSASSSEEKPARELVFSDFKEFQIAGQLIGIGQITCMDSERVLKRLDEFLAVMRDAVKKKGYHMMLLMLTDVLREGTELIYLGDDDVVRQAFNVEVRDHHAFLAGVVSRKKQVVPMLSLLWG